jgi:hypothetical protein
LTQILTCDVLVLKQMIADANGRCLEPERQGKFLKDAGFSRAMEKAEHKKEAEEIV